MGRPGAEGRQTPSPSYDGFLHQPAPSPSMTVLYKDEHFCPKWRKRPVLPCPSPCPYADTFRTRRASCGPPGPFPGRSSNRSIGRRSSPTLTCQRSICKYAHLCTSSQRCFTTRSIAGFITEASVSRATARLWPTRRARAPARRHAATCAAELRGTGRTARPNGAGAKGGRAAGPRRGAGAVARKRHLRMGPQEETGLERGDGVERRWGSLARPARPGPQGSSPAPPCQPP
jgi:hypothetical protein